MEPIGSHNENQEQAGAVDPEEKKLTSTSGLEDGTNNSVAPDLRSRFANQIELCSKVVLGKTFITCVVSLALVLIGIIFLTKSRVSISSREKIIDYTNCTAFDPVDDTNKTCTEYLLDHESCVCYLSFNITEELEGNLRIYYELETYDQSRNDYVKSRDDNQLKGELALIPSENCEPYRYDTVLGVKKPIYPCGEIADSMFNDTFELTQFNISNEGVLVPFIDHGLLTEADKLGYHNPNKTIDFQNFTKPKSWRKPIWELNTTNPENNGVQNEIFIGWMKTELKRKPYARVDQNQTVFAKGLGVGEYRLRVSYNYPTARYSGRRTFIISASVPTSNITFTVIGIAFLLVGLILLAKTIAIYLINNHVKAKENERPANDENLTNNR